MFEKDFSKIELEDIKTLIDNSVCEYRKLEYKQELHIDNDENRREFLYDISSFANSIGGYIIFGIEEDHESNEPKEIVGIPYETEDKLIRRIEDFIRQSIQPRILNIEYRVIPFAEKKCVLIIHVPQSILSPHRTEFKGAHKFYTRNSKGKYEMDVEELRLAFNSGLDLNKRIRDYKELRYVDILANKNNALDSNMPIFVVHYMPVISFSTSINIKSAKEIKKAMIESGAHAFGFGIEQHITVDGVQLISYTRASNYCTYADYKNNGIIEKATNDFFEKGFIKNNVYPIPPAEDVIYAKSVYDKLIDDFEEVKKYYEVLNINLPVIVSCAILNCRNYTILQERSHFYQLGKIDWDNLVFNDLYIENLDETTENILKPVFDSLWNACGYERCPYYDENEE